jgi:hypothetical protein
LAIPEAVLHFRAYRAFTDGLREEHGDQLIEWERQVQEWETDNSRPCPYDLPEESESSISLYLLYLTMRFVEVTQAAVKKKLSEEEHEKAARGEGDLNTLEITASDFVIAGIDLEEQQYVHIIILLFYF